MITRDQILEALADWVNKRPRLNPDDYYDRAGYRKEARILANEKRDAHRLIRAVHSHPSIEADELRAAFGAFGGRLELTEERNRPVLDYTPGQDGKTEFRAAACSVLSMAIRTYTRNNLPKDAPLKTQGDLFRAAIRREFGAPFQRRWFN